MDTFYKILLVFLIIGVLIIIAASIVGALIGTGVIPTPLTTQDCTVSNWSDYSSCTGGVQTRTRTVVKAQKGKGAVCPSLIETTSCTCPTTYTPWEPSDAVCLRDQPQVRTGTVSSSTYCSSRVFVESKTCGSIPVDCQLTWSPCINGTQTGTISTPAANGGQPCGEQIRSCNSDCVYTWSTCSNGVQTVTNFVAASGTGTCDVVEGQSRVCLTGEQFYLEFVPSVSGVTSSDAVAPTGSYLHVEGDNLLIPNFNIDNQTTLFKLDTNNNLVIRNNSLLAFNNGTLSLVTSASSNTFKLKALTSNPSIFYLSLDANPNVYYGLNLTIPTNGFPYRSIGIATFSSDAALFRKTTTFTKLPTSIYVKMSMGTCGTSVTPGVFTNGNCNLKLDISKSLLQAINYTSISNVVEPGCEFYLNPYMNELCFKRVGESNLNYISNNVTNNTYNLTSVKDSSILINRNLNLANQPFKLFKLGSTVLPFFMGSALTKNNPLIELGYVMYPSNTTCTVASIDSASTDFSTSIAFTPNVLQPISLTTPDNKFLTLALDAVSGGPILSLTTSTGTIRDNLGNTLDNYKFVLDQQGFLRYRFNQTYKYINQNINIFLDSLSEVNYDPLRLYNSVTDSKYLSSNFTPSASSVAIGNLSTTSTNSPIGYGVTAINNRLIMTNKYIGSTTNPTTYNNDNGIPVTLQSVPVLSFTATRV
jgi:hypothetical protein